MDSLVSRRQPLEWWRTLSQEIKTLRTIQMKDGSTERIRQGNLRRKKMHRLFPTTLLPPPPPVTPDVSVSRIRGLYWWDSVTS